MRRALWILGAVALVAVLAIGISQAGGPRQESADGRTDIDTSALEGAPAPLAKLHRAAGEIRASGDRRYTKQLRELRGYPVVVNAWASWCGPCKLEFPYFREASTRLGKKVAFLGLNVNDNREEAMRFLKKQPVPYPHLEDGNTRIGQKLGLLGLPATVFYDEKGERAYLHQGPYASEADLLRDIERYLKVRA